MPASRMIGPNTRVGYAGCSGHAPAMMIPGENSGYSPLDPSTGTALWFSSRDTSYMHQTNLGVGTVSADGDPVGYLVDHIAGVILSQGTSGVRPTYKTNVKNSNPVIRFGGHPDPRALRDLNPRLNTAKSLTIIATIKNAEASPPEAAYVADFTTLGSNPDVEFWLFNSFIDGVNVTLGGSAGTTYKNGATSPLTMTNGEWLVAQLDVPSGFTQTAVTLGCNGAGSANFFAAFDLMDILFIQPTPSAALLAQIYTWIKAPAGL